MRKSVIAVVVLMSLAAFGCGKKEEAAAPAAEVAAPAMPAEGAAAEGTAAPAMPAEGAAK